MQKNVKELIGFTVQATDGRLGIVQEVFFDDRTWTIRYLKALTAGPERHVLIPVHAFKEPRWDAREFDLNITKEKIFRSPGMDLDKPVTFDFEVRLADFYEWPVYPTAVHEIPKRGELSSPGMQTAVIEDELRERQLLGVNGVTGYRVLASGEEIGRLTDIMIDDTVWTISYLTVALNGGGTVLIGPDMVGDILTERREVTTNILKENIVPNASYREEEFTRVPVNQVSQPRRRGAKLRAKRS